MQKQRVMWRLVSMGSGALAAAGVKRIAGVAWKGARHEAPPEGVSGSDRPFAEALLWAVALALGFGVARLVADRVAAAAWTATMGTAPPVAEH